MIKRLRIRLARWLYPGVFTALEVSEWLRRNPPPPPPYLHHDTIAFMESRSEAGEHVAIIQEDIQWALHRG